MSFLAGSAGATLGLDVNPFRSGFMEAQGLAQLFPSIITNFMANPLLGLADIATKAFGILTDAFMSSLRRADSINDLSNNVGVAVEELSALGLVAEQAGSSTEAVADAYKFLGKNVAEAMGGSKEAVATFERLGVAFKDSSGNALPLEGVMMRVADSIAAMHSPALKTQAAMDLLGRSGTGLIGTFSQGSIEIEKQKQKYVELGSVVTTESAKSADAFGDLMGDMSKVWMSVQEAIGRPIRDALRPHLESLLQWVQKNMPTIQNTISVAMSWITEKIEKVIATIKVLKSVLDATIGAAAEWLAQTTMGDRVESSVGKATRTKADAIRDRDAVAGTSRVTNNITVQAPNLGASDAQIGAAVKEAARQSAARAKLDRGRVMREFGQ